MIPVIPEVEDFKKRHDVLVTTQWGMTEVCAPIVAVDYDVSIPQSCGRLRDGFEARIVDEFDHEVEDGEAGELVLRSDRAVALRVGVLGEPGGDGGLLAQPVVPHRRPVPS